jgi:AcrR family transcriptional regulator
LEKERKQQILKAAAKRFSRHGLNKTTLDEIARDLRIGKATIYHYFDTKEDLFYKTIEWEIELFIEDLKIIFNNEQLSLKEKLVEYFSFKTSIFSKYKLIYEVLYYTMKEELFEKEVALVNILFEKEIEFLKQYLQGKKEMQSEIASNLVIRSWGEMFSSKILSAVDAEKSFSKESIIIYIESLYP